MCYFVLSLFSICSFFLFYFILCSGKVVFRFVIVCFTSLLSSLFYFFFLRLVSIFMKHFIPLQSINSESFMCTMCLSKFIFSLHSCIFLQFHMHFKIRNEKNKGPCAKFIRGIFMSIWATTSKNVSSYRHVCPVNIRINLCICAVLSESWLGIVWIAKDARFLHADNVNSDQTAQMHRVIWVFDGHIC